jgi:hypothetical protein
LIYWLLNYYYSQKEYYIPYEIKKIAVMFICGALLSFVGLLINEFQIIPRLLIKSGCIIGFPFILYLFKFYEPAELQLAKGFVAKWSKISNLRDNLKSLNGFTN